MVIGVCVLDILVFEGVESVVYVVVLLEVMDVLFVGVLMVGVFVLVVLGDVVSVVFDLGVDGSELLGVLVDVVEFVRLFLVFVEGEFEFMKVFKFDGVVDVIVLGVVIGFDRVILVMLIGDVLFEVLVFVCDGWFWLLLVLGEVIEIVLLLFFEIEEIEKVDDCVWFVVMIEIVLFVIFWFVFKDLVILVFVFVEEIVMVEMLVLGVELEVWDFGEIEFVLVVGVCVEFVFVGFVIEDFDEVGLIGVVGVWVLLEDVVVFVFCVILLVGFVVFVLVVRRYLYWFLRSVVEFSYNF